MALSFSWQFECLMTRCRCPTFRGSSCTTTPSRCRKSPLFGPRPCQCISCGWTGCLFGWGMCSWLGGWSTQWQTAWLADWYWLIGWWLGSWGVSVLNWVFGGWTTHVLTRIVVLLTIYLQTRRGITVLTGRGLKDKDKDLFIGPQEFVLGYSKAPEQC